MKKEENISGYISTKKAAEELDYTVQHTRYLIREEKLDATKFGRDWMIVRESVKEYKLNKKEK